MRTDKQLATKLRLQGKSYAEISRSLNVPKSTLSDWFRNLILSGKAQAKIDTRRREGSYRGLLKRSRNQTELAQKRAWIIRKNAKQNITSVSGDKLFFLGVGLYWGEGYKRPIIKNGKARTYHPVKLTNSDPYLIRIFLRFLREICNTPEEKIKASLRIYKHLNEAALINFWSNVTKIDPNKFKKSYYGISRSSLGKRPYNILPYGTIEITVNSTELYHRIMGWIEALHSK